MNISDYRKIGLNLAQVLINRVTRIFKNMIISILQIHQNNRLSSGMQQSEIKQFQSLNTKIASLHLIPLAITDNILKYLRCSLKNKLVLIIFLAVSLSGCVNYDLGVNFNHTNNGELVQHIQLSKQLSGFSGDYIFEWLKTLERRTKNLQGSVKHISEQEMIMKIPFTNGRELQEKFNVFFPYQENDNAQESADISANLISSENNFLLLSKHHLVYDLDLRSLAILAGKKDNVTTNNSLLNMDFSLQTPWGVKNIQTNENSITPEKQGNQFVWRFQPGKLNHIEVVFWLPNMLGIGTLIIIIFVGIGFYLKGYLGEKTV